MEQDCASKRVSEQGLLSGNGGLVRSVVSFQLEDLGRGEDSFLGDNSCYQFSRSYVKSRVPHQDT